MSDNGGFMITGADRIEKARWLSVRSALRLEIRGFRHSRGLKMMPLANAITGENHKRKREAYAALNAHIVKEMGEELDHPLNF